MVGESDLGTPVPSSFTKRGSAFQSGILMSRANCIRSRPGNAGEYPEITASGTGAGGGVFGVPLPDGGTGGASTHLEASLDQVLVPLHAEEQLARQPPNDAPL